MHWAGLIDSSFTKNLHLWSAATWHTAVFVWYLAASNMVGVDYFLLVPRYWEGFKLFYFPRSSHFSSGPLTSMRWILMVNRRTADGWGGERADSLIMEAAASPSPLFNAVGSCHHDLHDVITSITLMRVTKGFAVRDSETEKGQGTLGIFLHREQLWSHEGVESVLHNFRKRGLTPLFGENRTCCHSF